MDELSKYERYAQRVENGEETAGGNIRLAVARFRTYLNNPEYEFRPDKVEHVINFVALLKHFKNRHAGKPFILEPWQAFIVACVYGFYHRGTNRRVCKKVYIEIARKNGKTAFAAALCLYHLVADGVAGAEVDMVANSRDQAAIAFGFASSYADGLNTPKHKRFRTLRRDIFFDANKSTMKVFASDASKLDGFDASMYLIDEYHAAPNTLLRDVLKSSQASRENPMEVIITTAGFDKSLPCYQYRQMCVEVLNGLADDPSLWPFIFALDDTDDWTAPANWRKVSPNLGVSVQEAFMVDQVTEARNNPASEVGIRTKTFNTWLDSSQTWIPHKYIVAASFRESIEEVFEKGECRCFAGIDLAATSDLTALAVLIVKTVDGVPHHYFFTHYYLPQETISTSPLSSEYREWVRRGYMTATPGNVTDYTYILNDLRRLDTLLTFEPLGIGYDSWNATQFVIAATNDALPMAPFSQSIGNFNQPTKEMERLLLSGFAHIHDNPVTRWCFANVVIRQDMNGNTKPDKSKSASKIDGVIAMTTALGVSMKATHHVAI